MCCGLLLCGRRCLPIPLHNDSFSCHTYARPSLCSGEGMWTFPPMEGAAVTCALVHRHHTLSPCSSALPDAGPARFDRAARVTPERWVHHPGGTRTPGGAPGCYVRKKRTSNSLPQERPSGSSCPAGPRTPQPPAPASAHLPARPRGLPDTALASHRHTQWLPRELGLLCRAPGPPGRRPTVRGESGEEAGASHRGGVWSVPQTGPQHRVPWTQELRSWKSIREKRLHLNRSWHGDSQQRHVQRHPHEAGATGPPSRRRC